jgi:two-component system phosphate regulon sensor histidine kinase PhoR
MRELVEDVLILSQLDELGTTKPRNDEMASLNLYTIVNDCIDRLTPFADQMNVAFHLKKQGETQVCGSAQILSSMVYNLCENAIRYNQEGGSVNIDLSSQDDAVRLSIADTGIGISADEQQRVFERFYRVDRTRSRLTGGTGLGLAIVKHGANYHGATLSLSSTPGKGSCITISFPIAAH